MAEEAQYSSGGDFATAKRKYDDSTTAPPPSAARRQTGFSAPIIPPHSSDSASAYNSVPPPVDEIELAKQRAQEIAARIFNNAEAKRPKFENGGGYDSNDGKGFSSAPTEYGQKPYSSTFSMPSAYGYGNSSKKIEIPNGRVGVIIGKGGETIKYLQLQSGAKIQITRDMDADPNSLTRAVEISGSSESIAQAEQLIKDVLAEAESGGSGIVSRRLPGQQGGAEQFVMQVANNKVGLIIGKGGETIKSMQASSGARIQVIPLHLPPGDTSTERTVQINGSAEQIEAAKQLVNEVISENRLRNPMGSGGYSQQGYQARPQTNSAPPGLQMQQQGYGYTQAGGYPGQYTQPPYGGYSGQQTSGGYATGWDQSAAGAAPAQQTAQGGGGYDYYNQQQAPQTKPPGGPTGPTDAETYGYSQQGQTYGQDGYGGYGAPQSGYGQPQGGYGQQGYANPTSGYNTSSESTKGQSGSYGAQGDSANQAPPLTSAPQSGYVQPTQPGYVAQPPSGYGGYGPPPTQKPPVTPTYGQQTQPSPQGAYAQPAPYAGGYAQPPAYGAGGYSQAPYGQPPPAYGSSYGSGYPQPAPTTAYSGDAAAAPPAPPQATPPSGGAAAKASPQS
ncbi:hypothetical protein SSX86_008496 [Deinandra increscens subsp. villosa]|uniref:K Homology domain-containing protein n=1 Tax=Deinandra increscens subsp. villosa TaxID=3103831 RepID=A0AAP0DBT2_9ASTR